MKKFDKCLAMLAACGTGLFANAETETLALTNGYRTFVKSSVVYEVGSRKTADALPARASEARM